MIEKLLDEKLKELWDTPLVLSDELLEEMINWYSNLERFMKISNNSVMCSYYRVALDSLERIRSVRKDHRY